MDIIPLHWRKCNLHIMRSVYYLSHSESSKPIWMLYHCYLKVFLKNIMHFLVKWKSYAQNALKNDLIKSGTVWILKGFVYPSSYCRIFTDFLIKSTIKISSYLSFKETNWIRGRENINTITKMIFTFYWNHYFYIESIF